MAVAVFPAAVAVASIVGTVTQGSDAGGRYPALDRRLLRAGGGRLDDRGHRGAGRVDLPAELTARTVRQSGVIAGHTLVWLPSPQWVVISQP